MNPLSKTQNFQDLKRWQGSGVWLPVYWRQQSWPQELLEINQLRMVRLLSHNLSSQGVTFKSLNKLGNSEKLYQERLYSNDQKTIREEMGKKEKGKKEKGKKEKGKKERQRGKKEGKGKEKIKPPKEINQRGRKVEK